MQNIETGRGLKQCVHHPYVNLQYHSLLLTAFSFGPLTPVSYLEYYSTMVIKLIKGKQKEMKVNE
jgi:hypothetical protein